MSPSSSQIDFGAIKKVRPQQETHLKKCSPIVATQSRSCLLYTSPEAQSEPLKPYIGKISNNARSNYYRNLLNTGLNLEYQHACRLKQGACGGCAYRCRHQREYGEGYC